MQRRFKDGARIHGAGRHADMGSRLNRIIIRINARGVIRVIGGTGDVVREWQRAIVFRRGEMFMAANAFHGQQT